MTLTWPHHNNINPTQKRALKIISGTQSEKIRIDGNFPDGELGWLVTGGVYL